MKAKFAITLFAIATLCVTALAQEKTADDWFNKGQELARNGSYEEAMLAYDKAIELEPNNATFYIAKMPSLNVLALITNNQSMRNTSMKALDKALQLDPKNPSAWEMKGSTLSQAGRYNESLEAFDKAIRNISNYKPDGNLNQTEFLSFTWTSKSISLWQLMRYNESLEAVDKAVKIDPAGNYDAWAFKGELLAYLGRYNESLQAFEGAAATETAKSQPEIKALPWAAEGYVLMQMGRYEDADRIYQKIIGLNFTSEGANRRLADAWRGRGNALANLGEYNQSIQAFNKSIEVSQEIAPYAWTDKGNTLRAYGRYDEMAKAYGKALELYPEYADAGIASAQKGRGDALDHLGKHNEALTAYSAAVKASDKAISAFNNATPVDKAVSFTLFPYPLDGEFWHNRAFALHSIGREAKADAAYAKAKELGFEVSTKSQTKGSSTPVRMLAITAITSAGKNKSVEITNSRTEAQSFNGWTLNIDDGMNQSAALPDITLGPDKKVNIHFGQGMNNGTDLFLNSSIALNDTAGNITLKNETGKTAASFGYKIEPDGSVTGMMVAKGEFSYPQSGSNDVKMVVREAGNGPYVTERSEYKTEATQSVAPAVAQANTADYWYRKGIGLMGNGSYEEATNAYEKAIELNSTNATLWDAKASSLAVAATFSGNRSQYNESLKAQDKAIELDPKNSTLFVHKGFLIASLADLSGHKNESMYEEAIKEFDNATLLNPQDKEAWNWKGMVLDTRLNRSDEALADYDKAIEIDGTNASDKILLANAWDAKGGALAKLGRYNESTAAFDKAIELNPQNAASIWYMKAMSINASGQYDEAVKAYDKAIDLSKENVTTAQAYEGKGTALFKLGKYDEAVTAYDNAIELFPFKQMSGPTWYKKGIVLKALGKNSKADAAFAKAKELGYKA